MPPHFGPSRTPDDGRRGAGETESRRHLPDLGRGGSQLPHQVEVGGYAPLEREALQVPMPGQELDAHRLHLAQA